jgi:hypothetical protein
MASFSARGGNCHSRNGSALLDCVKRIRGCFAQRFCRSIRYQACARRPGHATPRRSHFAVRWGAPRIRARATSDPGGNLASGPGAGSQPTRTTHFSPALTRTKLLLENLRTLVKVRFRQQTRKRLPHRPPGPESSPHSHFPSGDAVTNNSAWRRSALLRRTAWEGA